MRYDVVIIGSGLGGLCVGSLLSKHGMSVLVLEGQQQAGGSMQSYTREGYRFDTGMHYVGGLGEGHSLFAECKTLGLLDLPWKKLDEEGFDRIQIGETLYQHASGFETFVEVLAKAFPNASKSIKEYVDMLQKLRGNIDTFSTSAYTYLINLLKDPLLLNVICGSSFKTELRKESLPLFTFIENNAPFIESSWRLQGDGGMIVKRLVKQIEKAGGKVQCNSEVVELVERGEGLAVAQCKHGEEWEGNIFVSDIHPYHLCDLIKESKYMKHAFKRRVTTMENTIGMFTLSLFLKPHSMPYFNYNYYLHEGTNVWEENRGERIEGVMVSCRVPEGSENFTDCIDLLTSMPWERVKKWENTFIGHRGEEYLEFKNRIAEECISIAERVLPSLRQCIQRAFVSTPLTWRDYNHSPMGTAYGIRKDYTLGVRSMLSTRTSIPNLFLTGQSVHLHGMHGVIKTAFRTYNDILSK